MTPEDWLRCEDFTLVLSAGFFGFYAHAGVLVALEAAGLRPRRIVGVSAGALAGGLWASGLPAVQVGQHLLELERKDFWDPGLPVGGLLRGHKFDRELRRVLAPTRTELVEHCPVPFAAVVHDILRARSEAVTSGELPVAIRASCAVPLMFRPVLHRGALWVDGGVSDRIGECALEPDERVLVHYIPSRRRWRRTTAPPVVSRRGLTLLTPGLPALGPFALDRRREAYEIARAHAEQWLMGTIEATPI